MTNFETCWTEPPFRADLLFGRGHLFGYVQRGPERTSFSGSTVMVQTRRCSLAFLMDEVIFMDLADAGRQGQMERHKSLKHIVQCLSGETETDRFISLRELAQWPLHGAMNHSPNRLSKTSLKI